MASYRYESSRIGDVVLWEDKKLLVVSAVGIRNPCSNCFFDKSPEGCTGVACLPHERDDCKEAIFQEITY